VLRVIFGIAMGGEWGVGASPTMESIPPHARGFVSGLLQSGYPTGYFLASIVYGLLFQYIGWRGMFMVGVIPIFAAAYRNQLLIIDDFGLSPVGSDARHDLLEILEQRYGRRSTIITSQFPADKWHGLIGDPTYADAILDRIVYNAHRIVLTGESLRKKRKSITSEKTS
jgi:MFS family permease